MTNNYIVEQDDTVLTVTFDKITVGWEQWIFLTSDQHHDNPMCRRDLEQRHLEQVKERKALAFFFGDTFCAMQGKYDPRSSMDDIRPEDVGADYLDRIVKHAAEFYGPYAKNIKLMGLGNHETNIIKRHHTNLIGSLAHRLNSDYGGAVKVGNVSGWIPFVFKGHQKRQQSINLYYHHGGGAGAEVTKGVIRTARMAVYMPDAELVVMGHNHNAYDVPLRRARLSHKRKPYYDYIRFIRTPGYKDEFGEGGQWHHEREREPKPLGGSWIRFFYDGSDRNRRINYEVMLDVMN